MKEFIVENYILIYITGMILCGWCCYNIAKWNIKKNYQRYKYDTMVSIPMIHMPKLFLVSLIWPLVFIYFIFSVTIKVMDQLGKWTFNIKEDKNESKEVNYEKNRSN